MKIQIESLSVPVGKENGDYILHQELPNGATLILLADGMGSLSLPGMASEIVCEAISEYFINADINDSSEYIRRSIKYADDCLAELCKEKKCKMGVALTLVYISNLMLFYTSFGDVRLYHKNKHGEVVQLTDDDVIFQGEDAYLTTYIKGGGFRNPIQVQRLLLNIGDSLLLCSDGYYKLYDTSNCFHYKDMTTSKLADDDCSVIRIEVL